MASAFNDEKFIQREVKQTCGWHEVMTDDTRQAKRPSRAN
jgi:hypothetical protein